MHPSFKFMKIGVMWPAEKWQNKVLKLISEMTDSVFLHGV